MPRLAALLPSLGRLPRVGKLPRLLLAGCCLLLAFASAVGRRSAAPEPPATEPVVVAAGPLPAGHLLRLDDLDIARWPPGLRPDAARGDPHRLVGRRLAGPVADGEAITAARLVGADLATGLPRGLVAAAVTLGDPHAVDFVRSGNRVDLLETTRPPDVLVGAPAARSSTTVLTTRALVVAALPATTEAGAELVVAVEPATAARITRDSATHVFTAVVVPP